MDTLSLGNPVPSSFVDQTARFSIVLTAGRAADNLNADATCPEATEVGMAWSRERPSRHVDPVCDATLATPSAYLVGGFLLITAPSSRRNAH